MFTPARAVVAHGFWRLKNVRENSRLTPWNGSEIDHQTIAVFTSSVACGVELAALVDQPGDRLGQHRHQHRARDQQQADLAHAVGHRGPQVVGGAARGQPREGRETAPWRSRSRTAPAAAGRCRNALSIAAGASSETSVPTSELISRLRLIIPSAIVTGSISLQHLAHALVAPVELERELASVAAQPRQRQQELDHRARQHADGVGVDLVLLREQRA